MTSTADRNEVLTDVRKYYGSRTVDIEWLPGDASNRSYARLKFQNPDESRILMVMNAPEAFKSEEVTGSDEAKIKELPFVTVDRSFEKSGIRVPRIDYVSSDSRFLILEDLGDLLLYDYQAGQGIQQAMRWYEKALEELVRLQKVPPFSPARDRRFTPELLEWEFEHFVEYALLKRDKQMTPAVLAEIRNFGKKIVSAMASSAYVLCHRDFHSKNLILLEKENKIGVIDFQDALMGPPSYDLASFLRDSYVRLTDDQEKHLLNYYVGLTGKPFDANLYALTSIQRNLKAAGRFYYISMVKGRDTHLPYVAPTMKRVFKTLRDVGEVRVLSVLEGLMREEVGN